MVVLVTGGNGQLGQALHFIAGNYPEIAFHFIGSADLDITRKSQTENIFQSINPDFCVNAAAYTAVDKAETESEIANAINVSGVRNLAEVCKKHKTILIHISTDFVFDGNKTSPYTEEDLTNPQSVYGQTKRDGENEILKIWPDYFILRTSWVYSQFGNNFMKTMLKLAQQRTNLSVVNDQKGTPTHAIDLAEVIVKIIFSGSKNFGIYNFSNEGEASWYDFAREIFELNRIEIDLKPIPTTDFPTPAKRPKYSVLDKYKIKKEFQIPINTWKEALHNHN